MTTERSFAVAAPDRPTRCLGIDLESIARFKLVAKPGGRAFFDRVYTSAEQASASDNPVLLALYFTAKEAVAKALGTGLGLNSASAVSGKDIEIRWTPGEERPRVALWRGAAARAEYMHLSDVVVIWEHTARLVGGGAAGGAGRRRRRGVPRTRATIRRGPPSLGTRCLTFTIPMYHDEEL